MGLGGHVDLRGWCTHHLEVTATAGRAFAAVPEDRFRSEASLAWEYVKRRQATDGGWDSYWWVGRHYPTLQAVALGAALGEPEPAARAARWTGSEQLPSGAWSEPGAERSAFASALALAVLLRAGVTGDAITGGLRELISLQRDDGGWPGHASMRIPPPHIAEPDGYESWRVNGLGTGVVVRDQHRLFTTAACVSSLALASRSVP
jgi:squalene cyclase